MVYFKFEEMITCFILAGREDLIQELEIIQSQLEDLSEEDNDSYSDEEETFEIGTTEDGFYFLH